LPGVRISSIEPIAEYWPIEQPIKHQNQYQ
jgi:hypothetical protein